MDQCPEIANATISNSNETWLTIDRTTLKDLNINSYFRPDIAAALIPWILALILIITHLPTLIIRVVRWENVQIVCLASTLFTIIVYIQGYVSTQLTADKVLLWNPLILVIDAGSMLQISVLVLEENLNRRRKSLGGPESNQFLSPRKETSLLSYLQKFFCAKLTKQDRPAVNRNKNGETEVLEIHQSSDQAQKMPEKSVTKVNHLVNNQEEPSVQDQPTVQESSDVQQQPHVQEAPSCLPTYCALLSALLFLAVVALQITGLRAAIKAKRNERIPRVSWCSPAFQPNGVSVMDGDCHVYAIDQSVSRGVGCINIPGVWQKTWLDGTIIGIALSLVCQVIDMVVLVVVSGSKKWRGLKMKRPWTTMILGLVMLCVTFLYSYQYASMLPPGITERVTIAVDAGGLKAFDAHLSNAGMRGTVIAWNDGIFASWGGLYNGSLFM